MSYTLFTATLELAKVLGHIVEGTATGGSTTTLLDTTRTEADDYFNAGTIWFVSGNNANKTAIVNDWVKSLGKFEFLTPGAACAAGNLYAALGKEYPRDLLRRAINQALQEIGSAPVINDTKLTVANQMTYTLPTDVYNLVRVGVAQYKTAPYDFLYKWEWTELPGGILRWHEGCQPDQDNYLIRLIYRPRLAEVSADSDTIDDVYKLNRVKWEAAVYALRNRESATERQVIEAERQRILAASENPLPGPLQRDDILSDWATIEDE